MPVFANQPLGLRPHLWNYDILHAMTAGMQFLFFTSRFIRILWRTCRVLNWLFERHRCSGGYYKAKTCVDWEESARDHWHDIHCPLEFCHTTSSLGYFCRYTPEAISVPSTIWMHASQACGSSNKFCHEVYAGPNSTFDSCLQLPIAGNLRARTNISPCTSGVEEYIQI